MSRKHRYVGKVKFKVKTTAKQKQAVDNIVSGKFKSVAAAVRDAGYSDKVAKSASQNVLPARGIEVYLELLDKKAQRQFNLCLKDKVMEVYLDGLDATKRVRVGKRSFMDVDHLARKAFADRFSEFFGWTKETPPQQQAQQYNFFMFSKVKRDTFNEKFKEFLKGMRG